MSELIISYISKILNITAKQIKNTLSLLEEGNTVAFIARYRKEATSGLDEEQIRMISEQYEYQVNLTKRKEDIKRLIETQGKLTQELIVEIDNATKLVELEDIYRPYQQKRKTRASNAINAGLKPLAEEVLKFEESFDYSLAKKFICDEYVSEEAVLQGVKDIIAEIVSDNKDYRNLVRKEIYQFGKIKSKLKKENLDDELVYKVYYDYSESIKTIAAHRIMAMNRGEEEKILLISFDYTSDVIENLIFSKMIKNRNSNVVDFVKEAILDGLDRLMYPSIEREIRNELSEKAHEKSIDIFSLNLEKLLLQAPIKDKWILGLDPAYRTGCKLAVVNDLSHVEEISIIYPTLPNAQEEKSEKELLRLVRKYPIQIIAIGNGTASRESEAFVANFINKYKLNIQYTIVSEAGASVYSASPLAKEEFPNLSVEQRSAISIARRICDPLSELIKIDPKSIGVGQYQHDLPQKRLTERLNFVVEKAVNRVGVNVNQASATLLQHISGLSSSAANEIVKYRIENGKIKNRAEIKKIPKIGPKTYTQAIGFLRVLDSKEELDNTNIHPESYDITKKLLKHVGIESIFNIEQVQNLRNLNIKDISIQLNCDEYTLKDIVDILLNGNRDYREQFDAPLLKSNILTVDDLKEGDVLEGIVRNVVDFGAFVDIGLKNDGLIHITKFGKRIHHPSQMVSVGDIIEVKILSVDEKTKKVSLSFLNKKGV